MSNHSYFILGVLLALVTACGFSRETLKGSGKQVREDRNLSGFRRIHLHGAGDLLLTQGPTFQVAVEADDNFLQYMKTEVIGNDLELTFDAPRWVWVQPTAAWRFHVTLPELTEVMIRGSGDCEGTGIFHTETLTLGIHGSGDIQLNIQVDDLMTAVNGSGDVSVAGSARRQVVEINGSGNYQARDLASEEAKIEIHGSGDVLVKVSQRLEAAIHGSGDIQYLGDPEIQQRIHGAGSVHKGSP